MIILLYQSSARQMIKKSLFLFFIIVLFSGLVRGQHTLIIEIAGFKSDEGVVMLQLLDENQKIIRQDKGIIKEEKSSITFNDLKPGKYAVRYYHDKNLDGVFEKNKTGIPTEGYGFSNDAYGKFGPKSFKDWLFELNENKKLILKIKY
jgi:uncharacterized protein (DUF2141 family)